MLINIWINDRKLRSIVSEVLVSFYEVIDSALIMDEVWHRISYKGAITNGLLLAEAYAAAGSPWFSGHFPDEPILPGIAILAMVTDAVRHHAAEKGERIRITSIRKVRFRLPVKPDELLAISLSFSSQEEGLTGHFQVELNGKMVCTGNVFAEALPTESHTHEAFS